MVRFCSERGLLSGGYGLSCFGPRLVTIDRTDVLPSQAPDQCIIIEQFLAEGDRSVEATNRRV